MHRYAHPARGKIIIDFYKACKFRRGQVNFLTVVNKPELLILMITNRRELLLSKV